MVNKNIIRIITFLVIFITEPVLALNTVTASVDKNPVMQSESFILTVTADDDINSNALNTSALAKDFIIGRSSVSTQTSIVNLKTTRSTRWTIVLIARKLGSIVIPPLTINGKKTKPINLNVIASSAKNTEQQDIFIDTKLSQEEVYVQQLVTLKVKLYFATELKRGSLSEPSLTDANVVQIGQDKESEEIVNGRRYRVIERSYAISPQNSGQYTITAPRFSGEIMTTSSRGANFFNFGETKPVSVISEDISLMVLPIPLNYQGQWLPSELLSLHQEWQPNLTTYTVGDPITRKITLTAAGLSKEQLPKLSMTVPSGLKVYPDQEELHATMNNNRIVSQKIQSFAIVASKAGTFTLPAISIPWWNTITNKIEHAQIAAQTITVQNNPDSNLPQTTSPSVPLQTTNTEPPQQVIITKQGWQQWLYLALWLLTSFAWFISSRLKTKRTVTIDKPHKQKINTYQALINACKNHQATEVLPLIIPWVNTLTQKQASTIDEVIKQINQAQFTIEINQLQCYLYGEQQANSVGVWQGKTLHSLIKNIQQNGLLEKQQVKLTLNP